MLPALGLADCTYLVPFGAQRYLVGDVSFVKPTEVGLYRVAIPNSICAWFLSHAPLLWQLLYCNPGAVAMVDMQKVRLWVSCGILGALVLGVSGGLCK